MGERKPKLPKVVMKWSKKEGDWIASYPDRAGKSLSGILFEMTKTTGHRMDWGDPIRKLLLDRGYDPNTFQISVQKLPAAGPGAERPEQESPPGAAARGKGGQG